MSRYANVFYPLVYFTNGIFQLLVFFFIQIYAQILPDPSFQTVAEQMYTVFSIVSPQSFHHFCISMILQCHVLTNFHHFLYFGSGIFNITMPIVSLKWTTVFPKNSSLSLMTNCTSPCWVTLTWHMSDNALV